MPKIDPKIQTYLDNSKLLKLIVTNDGLVMGLLESIFNEPIDIEFVAQAFKKPLVDWQDLAIDENVLVRNVFLKGLDTNRYYAYAVSYIRTDLLEQKVVDLYMQENIAIGNIIEQCHLETYREIVNICLATDKEIYALFPQEKHIIEKQYLIFVNKLPVMLIKEYYPHSLYDIDMES